ncbi:hypothetical protein WJX75_004455 [Coccomyxa subellipsoidea]|uniref:Uncharacterized protein n=1 Tax=Coccomyxa subellipsoidea TaxID=248742 RepID=A0ABR2YGM3_9CHLO
MQEAQERRKRLKSLRDDADVPEAHATGTGKLINPLLNELSNISSSPAFSFYSDPLAALNFCPGRLPASSLVSSGLFRRPGPSRGAHLSTHRGPMGSHGAPHRRSVLPGAKQHSGMDGRFGPLPIIQGAPDPHLVPRLQAHHTLLASYIRGEGTTAAAAAAVVQGRVRMAAGVEAEGAHPVEAGLGAAGEKRA